MKKLMVGAERFRIQPEGYQTPQGARYGMFRMPTGPRSSLLVMACAACAEMPWDHVSVSGAKGNKSFTPSWDEMCRVKDLFFDKDECVMQLHPPEKDYVNFHPNCLHLWRPADGQIPQPPSIAVGPKVM